MAVDCALYLSCIKIGISVHITCDKNHKIRTEIYKFGSYMIKGKSKIQIHDY